MQLYIPIMILFTAIPQVSAPVQIQKMMQRHASFMSRTAWWWWYLRKTRAEFATRNLRLLEKRRKKQHNSQPPRSHLRSTRRVVRKCHRASRVDAWKKLLFQNTLVFVRSPSSARLETSQLGADQMRMSPLLAVSAQALKIESGVHEQILSTWHCTLEIASEHRSPIQALEFGIDSKVKSDFYRIGGKGV